MLPPPGHQVPVSTPPDLHESSPDPFNDPFQSSVTQPEEWLKDQLQSVNCGSVDRATREVSNASSDKESLESSNRTFVQSQSTCTPLGPKANLKYGPDSKRDEHKKEVEADLGTVIKLDESKEIIAWVCSLYVDLAEDDDIKTFLARTNIHADGRWVGIPKDDGNLKEFQLYEPYVKVINTILQWFVHKVQDGTEASESSSRVAIDTHVTNLAHQDEETNTLWSRPDVSVKALGNSFQVPQNEPGKEPRSVGFPNMSSFKEMKLERQKWSDRDQWQQLGVYTRQIFIQQPNRRFVRALLLTEDKVRLFHFDRSGGMYTPFIDIHAKPELFIRLVVGLNSLDEEKIGLDTSIKWSTEDGRKVSGTLTARTAQKADGNSQTTYSLCEVDPIITYYCIRGRATQCWSVSDPNTGIQYLIKDCWKDETRVSEHVYLEEAKALPGVVQMVSFESNRGETKFLRGNRGTSHEDFHNRVAIRIVLNSYGESIENFKSAKQLLRALRDAIIGHMELYMKQILHRDVSIDNILLGKKANGPEPPPGFCGVLIDLHMAIKGDRDTAKHSADWRSGSSLFQSIAVLLSSVPSSGARNFPPPLAQDYLDDIESFFYVYTYLIYGFDACGVSFPIPVFILRWKWEHSEAVATSKRAYMSDKFVPKQLHQRWPKPCIKLLHAFQDWLRPYAGTKRELTLRNHEDPGSIGSEDLKALTEAIAKQYREVVRLFNGAICELEAESGNGVVEHNTNLKVETEMYTTRFTTPPLELPSSAPTTPGGYPDNSPLANRVLERNARKALKRYPEEDPDEVPEAKRGPEVPCTPPRKGTAPLEALDRPVKRKNQFVHGSSLHKL